MKAVILHGTGSDHTKNWFPWLKEELEQLNFEVWVPDLPGADKPDGQAYNRFLLSQGWDFQDNLLIGHSSGALEILVLLQALTDNVKVNTAILAGVFNGDLGRDDMNQIGRIELNYNQIRKKADRFIVVHSDDDQAVPLANALGVAKKLDVQPIIFHGFGHFSASSEPRFSKFPELLEIIKREVL